uniref:RanBP2-type domain-containing protein n=1 Tax=Leersia perrieri TaxID=77586 RepID=A0A0D9WYZ3_9ORYZ
MASAKVVENRGAFGSKRSRNDVSVREGDWSCPQCGNVNFSFRNVCNRGACGMGYGPGPELGRYSYGFRGSPMPVSSPWSGGALVETNDSTASRKRRGGPDGLSEGDWKCPKCDNVNFSFRNNCNMKKCGAPRPNPGSNAAPPRKDNKDAPEGSWTCPECNNLNYPFRTACNRKGCGSSRPASAN